MSSGRTRQRPPMSSPARGTWIEMHLNAHKSTGVIPSSPARGTWIEIMLYPPPPACGPLSSPARGTWIEIAAGWRDARGCRVVPRKGDVDRNIFHAVNGHGGAGSSPARGTWIEIQGRESKVYGNDGSSPARGTWIEIIISSFYAPVRPVVPRKGDVDRNTKTSTCRRTKRVVPRKGDVDRNCAAQDYLVRDLCVVPRKGDVDRNAVTDLQHRHTWRSSPARGTWIEITRRWKS